MTRPPLHPGAIIAALHRHDVDFVVIGGVAAHAHGADHQPADFDIVLRSNWSNYENTAAALRDLDARPSFGAGYFTDEERARLASIRPTATAVADPVNVWDTAQGGIDILDAVSDRAGRELYYEHLLAAAVVRTVAGRPVTIIGLADLIAAKAAAGRPKDRPVVEQLEAIASGRRSALNRLDPPHDLRSPPSRQRRGFER